MRDKKNLSTAKSRKNDEFYTLLSDIENELKHYTRYFKEKTVYLPFDDYEKSNFVKYFKTNFKTLGLKKLISTHIHLDGTRSELYEYDGVEEKIILLNDNGDFRGDECTKIKNSSDIIVSNPPFSLFREIIDWLDDKDFLLLGNQNAICYKNVFPKIKMGTIRLGVTHRGGNMTFEQPTIYEDVEKIVVDGRDCVKMCCVTWFTTLDHGYKPQPIQLVKKYTPEAYPKYDNYDAINVDKTKDIPMDYEGIMGVPLTFLYRWNTEQFDIVGLFNWFDKSDVDSGLITGRITEYIDHNGKLKKWPGPTVDKHTKYIRILIKNKKILK